MLLLCSGIEAPHETLSVKTILAPAPIRNQVDKLKFDGKPNELDSANRRIDKRIVVNAPVEIVKIDHGKEESGEQIFIEDVGDCGCRFSMRGAVEIGDKIMIRLLAEDGASLLDAPAKFFEVMWVTREAETSTVGARIVQGEQSADCKRGHVSTNAKHRTG